jgi:hypothetical protein
MSWPLSQEPTLILATQLLSCLSQAVTGFPNPPGSVCLRVGNQPAHDLSQWEDLCCDGLAYVSLGDTYPSSDSFPDQDIIRQANSACAPASWAQQFQYGIIRCVPVSSTSGTGFAPPSCEQWTAAATQNFYDSAALRQATCCFRNWIVSQDDGPFLGMSVVMNRQTQVNPNGGCVERNSTITVQFPNCDC